MSELHRIFEDAWQCQMRDNPIVATFYGDHRYNDELPSLKIENLKKSHEKNSYFLSLLNNIDFESLSSEDKINYQIFKQLLEDQIEEFNFKSYLLPISQVHGFHVYLSEIVNYTPFNTKEDYENYLSRLQAIEEFIQGHIDLMTLGYQENYTLPEVALDTCLKGLQAQVKEDPINHSFFRPFMSIPDHLAIYREEWQKKARQIISENIFKCYRKFIVFLKEEYIPKARKNLGISSLPNGKEYYEFLVRSQTTLNVNPQDVHEIGLAEVERIHGEIQKIFEKVNFKGTLIEFQDFLRNNEDFYAKSEKQLISEVSFILKSVDGQLPKFFKHMPRTPYGIKEVPKQIASRMPTAYYMPPSGDGSSAGFYFVNTYDLKSRPLYELEALSLHEAVPGHHFQIAIQQELENLPKFRRFAKFLGFLEGWALYSEKLGKDFGMYQDPYSDFGRLTYEMWRACRLVVDTGIHYFGWSREQAIDYLVTNSCLARHNIETEVDRYISLPGQAVSYKMGEIEFLKLRKSVEEQLGENFDIREFHDQVLKEGAVPLEILKKNIMKYTKQKNADHLKT